MLADAASAWDSFERQERWSTRSPFGSRPEYADLDALPAVSRFAPVKNVAPKEQASAFDSGNELVRGRIDGRFEPTCPFLGCFPGRSISAVPSDLQQRSARYQRLLCQACQTEQFIVAKDAEKTDPKNAIELALE